MVENAERGLTDEDLKKLRLKIKNAKGDIAREKSKLELAIVNRWY
jgi:hypothetical protein